MRLRFLKNLKRLKTKGKNKQAKTLERHKYVKTGAIALQPPNFKKILGSNEI